MDERDHDDPLPVEDTTPPVEPAPSLPAAVEPAPGAIPHDSSGDTELPATTDEDRTMALPAHLLTLAGGFIATLVHLAGIPLGPLPAWSLLVILRPPRRSYLGRHLRRASRLQTTAWCLFAVALCATLLWYPALLLLAALVAIGVPVVLIVALQDALTASRGEIVLDA